MSSALSMIGKIREIYAAQRDCFDANQKLAGILSGGPASYYYEKMEEYIDALLSFAKFKTGDHVVLAANVDCNDKSGWQCCEHFLKAGRTARVRDVDYSKGAFTYAIMFDKETWIDLQGDEHEMPERDKHIFWLRESSLKVFSAVA